MKLTKLRALFALAGALIAFDAVAVELSPDGKGQALIFPYYTVRSSGANPFNTYLSIVHHGREPGASLLPAKALRVRFREARGGREVAAFNLYLGDSDMWTAALVPDGEGTRLITSDAACTDPPLSPVGLAFSNAAYTGTASDGAGDGLDRTREGYVEVFEMGVLSGIDSSNAQITSELLPANCVALRPITQPVGAPTGRISGTATLINVANGQDFAVNAEALERLASRPYYRPISDPYPSFVATEIDPVSVVTANGAVYRSTWARGLDAVNAVLMRAPEGEYVVEEATRAATDMVLTFPTRHLHVSAAGASAPFAGVPWNAECNSGATRGGGGEGLSMLYFNRDAAGFLYSGDDPGFTINFKRLSFCGATHALPVVPGTGAPGRTVFASSAGTASFESLFLRSGFSVGGWARFYFTTARELVSQATSTRMDVATGAVVTGAHTYRGLPVTGFAARSLLNGTLNCGAQACQGNYGTSLPYRYTRQITP